MAISKKSVLKLSQERLELKNTVRALLVSRFTSRETASIEKLGIPCKSVEDLKVDSFDDELLRLLREELQNPQPKPDPKIRAAVMRARFSGMISKTSGNESAGKRKREDEEAERERKKRKEEEQLRNIESRLKEEEAERQEKEKEKERQRKMEKIEADRTMARLELEKVEKNAVKNFRRFCWPEANSRVMKDFDSLIRSRRYI